MSAGDVELPASDAQLRLWYLDRLDAGSARYNISKLVRLRGQLDVGALRGAIDALIARHEALRTRFASTGDDPPVQVIAAIRPGAASAVEIIDLRRDSSAETEARLAAFVAEEARRPFDLALGPLFRATLLLVGEDDHAVALSVHHAIADGASFGVLFDELSQCYRASRSDRSPELPALAIQYGDWAAWERRWTETPAAAEQLAYWRRRLAGAAPPLELPADRPRTSATGIRGGHVVTRLDPDLLARLAAVGREEHASLFMVMLAAFEALLFRTTERDAFLVGTVVSNRSQLETERVFGNFVNTLALPADVSGDPAFRELLRRVRAECLAAFAHQELPFERVVRELHGQRGGSQPLFSVLFALQTSPDERLRLPELAVDVSDVHTGTAKCDLTVSWSTSHSGALGEWEFDAERFDAARIRRMQRHYRTLLASVAADPDRRISTLDVLTSAERRRVLVRWNATARDYPRDAGLHALFLRQVRRAPDAVAVVEGDRSITYAELARRAHCLADRLIELGVQPETRVGICLPRSLDFVVAVLAVIAAGGAYVPLDPEYPAERLVLMQSEAGVSLVVARREGSGGVAALDAHVVDLADVESGRAHPPLDRSRHLPRHVSGEQLAYVMFTSGSTGTPKGVAVPHRAIARLVCGSDYVDWGPEQVFLLLAPTAFDASTFELWGALLNGGRLVVASSFEPAYLGSVVRQQGVTTLWLTAGLFHHVVETGLDVLRPLRELVAGGDALSPRLVRRARRELERCRIVNGYGPTECTTFTCCHRIDAADDLADSVPIGRPIANTRVFVLDGSLALAPPGVPGELCVGGDGLARGYFGRPGPTAERFVPNPYEREPGARMYRTGDRARHTPNGALAFLGRRDRQVKVRGFRVEPAEIERRLREHPGVREAVVVAREDRHGEKTLRAFLVARDPVSFAADDAARFLREKLPRHMVPDAVEVLERLPLDPNGKVDRNALLGRASAPAPAARATTPPRNELERSLAITCAELLGLPRVGVDDNFFTLGGHSMLAARLIARAGSATGKEVALGRFLADPTVAGLARAVAEAPERPERSEFRSARRSASSGGR